MSAIIDKNSGTISLRTGDPYKAHEVLTNLFRSLEDNSRCSVIFPHYQKELIVYKYCNSVQSRLEFSNRVPSRFPQPLQHMYESPTCKVYKVTLDV